MKKFIHGLFAKIMIIMIVLLVIGYFVYRDVYERTIDSVCDRLTIISIPCSFYHVHKADKAYSKGNSRIAFKYYIQGLKEFPEHSQARCNLANIYALQENYHMAIEQYKLALKYKPNYMQCRMNLGKVEAEDLAEYDEAIAEYKRVANTDTCEIWSFNKTCKRKIWIPFVFDNTKAIKENKSNAYYNMGLAYRWKTAFTPKERLFHNQYLLNAIEAYKKALKINENDYDTLYNLAVTYHLSGNRKDAGLNYCKAIEVKPLNYEAHVNLAILLDSMGYHKEAIVEFNKAGLLIGNKDNGEAAIMLNDLIAESHRKQLIQDEERHRKYIYYEESDIKRKKSFWDKITKFFSGDKKLSAEEELLKEEKEAEEKENKEDAFVEFKNGIYKLKMESDSDMNKRMKQCESKKIFKDM